MPNEQTFDLVVIGAGPGGYVASIRAAQLGMKVACVEKDKNLGGTCLNVGCIPSKALLESSELYAKVREKGGDHGLRVGEISFDFGKMMERKDRIVRQLTTGIGFLFKKNKVVAVNGDARIDKDRTVTVTRDGNETSLRGKNILIATGSRPARLPGVEIDRKTIVDSTGALSLPAIPKKLVVIGGGSIGLELGSVYLRLGGEVTVVEILDRIVPSLDREIGRELQKILQRQGMTFRLSTRVRKAEKGAGGDVELTLEDPEGSKMTADILLVAVGREPFTEGLGLKEAGIKTDEKGRIEVDSRWQTSLEGVYAIGDVIAGPMLAHRASEEGVAVAETLAGRKREIRYDAIPSVVYTWPEVASVGITEEGAKQGGIDSKVARFPLLANGRASTLGERDGLVKLIADKKTDRLLGGQIIAPRASDMIAELVLGMELSATAKQLAGTTHAHPTLAEAVKEAALGLGEGTIHS